MLYKIFERLFYGFTVNNNADVPPKHDVPLITGQYMIHRRILVFKRSRDRSGMKGFSILNPNLMHLSEQQA